MEIDSQDLLDKVLAPDEFMSMMSVVYDLASDKTDYWKGFEKPHEWMQYIKNILRTLTTNSPTWFHLNIAVKILTKSDEKTEPDAKLIELLARKFIENCKDLSRIMKYPEAFSHLFDQENTNPNKLEIVSSNNEECDKEFLSNGLFIWDAAYLKILEETGAHGKEVAKWLETDSEQFPSYFNKYIETKNPQYMKEFWFRKEGQDNEPFYSRALLILCECVWLDIVKPIWEKQIKNVPAITKGVLITTIKPPLSKNCKIEVSDTKITCYSEEGKSIAIVPCVDPKLVNLICRGMEAFSSLTGHKLFRWQVRTGFENWANEREDPRLICTTGGYEGIANLVGCGSSKKSPTEIKAILYAQAHGHFHFPQGGSGNMIILREMDKLRNGEPTSINIILGELLFPNFTHMLPQGEKRRLVPITELPPLIGSKNTHASQAMLQLLILEEFSNQSDALFQNSSIQITQNRWEQLAQEAKLPKTSLSRVISGWIEGDLFSKPFLDKQGDEYTLGPTYGRVLNFLEQQGKHRIDGSKGGEKAAVNKKVLIGKNYSKKKNKY